MSEIEGFKNVKELMKIGEKETKIKRGICKHQNR